jgi:predicted acetyltransferase
VAGYVAWRQRSGEYSGMGGPFRLVVDDFVWTTRDAGLALWRLLGSWATQVERIYWRGGIEDASYLLLPEQVAETLVDLRWMTRVVDAPRAVAARGFALGIELEVPLELVDEGLPENSGRWWLRVREGRGRLERGGPGGARLDIGAFSALYTGWASSAVLVRAGRLAGAGERERSALDAAFAGPTPWLLDEF